MRTAEVGNGMRLVRVGNVGTVEVGPSRMGNGGGLAGTRKDTEDAAVGSAVVGSVAVVGARLSVVWSELT